MSSRPQPYKTIPKREKNRLTEDQLRLLETSFNQEKKLEPERKFQLARQLGMPAKQVAIWYQNRRARWKTRNIELDYQTIQAKLENALADEWRLQNEVGRLKTEVQKAQDILSSFNCSTTHPVTCSLSGSCDGNGSTSNRSSLANDVNCHWQNTELWKNSETRQSTESWQVEDLYACLLGSEGANRNVK